MILRANKKGFTLIELLVVISIISFLSSIVLASLNTAREKGRLGAAMQFSAQLQHQQGKVGYWSFNNQNTNDESGFNNSLITSGGITYSSDTYNNKAGYSAIFNKAQYIQIDPNNSNFNFDDNTSFTLAAWIKPNKQQNTSNTSGRVFSKGHWGPVNGYALQVYTPSTGPTELSGGTQATWFSVNSPDLSDGKWHHVAMVVNRKDHTITIYVDGQAASPYIIWETGRSVIENDHIKITDTSNDHAYTTTEALCVGSGGELGTHICNTDYYGGLMDEPMILAEILTSYDIQKMFADGLKTHPQI